MMIKLSPPLFSIITVAKNNLDGLKQTHQSIIIQTVRDMEWIVIDGASTDGTADWLATTQDTNWTSESDAGIYDAMNKGLDRAKGTYALFLNAGDTLADPDTLEKITDYIGTTRPDFIYGDAWESGNYKTARPHTKILWGMPTHHQAMFYRIYAKNMIRYDTAYKISADYAFTLRVLQQAQDVTRYPLPICTFQPGGVSQHRVLTGRLEQFIIRKKLGTPILYNAAIFCAQTFAYILRKIIPPLYWYLKKQPPPSGNIENATTQTAPPPGHPESPAETHNNAQTRPRAEPPASAGIRALKNRANG